MKQEHVTDSQYDQFKQRRLALEKHAAQEEEHTVKRVDVTFDRTTTLADIKDYGRLSNPILQEVMFS